MTTTMSKRQRERNRDDKKKAKESKRRERSVEKANRPDAPPGVDPDIADIIPGPQPRLEEEDF